MVLKLCLLFRSRERTRMSWSLIAYIFLCIVIGLSTVMALMRSDRSIAGVLCLVLFILIFVFYGLRWFRGTQSVFEYNGTWPPIINMCPDYLVYYKNTPSNSLNFTDSCVDLLGLGANDLVAWTTEETPANPPANANKYFQFVFKPGMTAKEIQNLCTQAQVRGLTWEGIFNGESCLLPITSSSTNGTTTGTTCPGGAPPCPAGKAKC